MVSNFHSPDATRLAELCMEDQEKLPPGVAAARSEGYVWPAAWLEVVYDSYQPELSREFPLLLQRLVNLKQQREAIKLIEIANDHLATECPDSASYLSNFVERVSGIVRSAAPGNNPLVSARIKAIHDRIDAGRAYNPIPIPVPELNASLGGIDFGGADFWVLAGSSGAGKTRTAISLIGSLFNFMESRLRCSWISTESGFSPDKIAALFIAQLATQMVQPSQSSDGFSAGIGAREYLSGRYMGSIWEDEVRAAEEIVSKWHLWIHGPRIEDGGTSVLDNALAVATMDIDVHGANLVVLDNYQQMEVPGVTDRLGANRDYTIMSLAVPAFARLTASRGIVHIGISQLNRGDTLAAGRGMEYEANVILSLTRSANGIPDDQFDLRALKVRDGPLFGYRMRFDKSSGMLLGVVRKLDKTEMTKEKHNNNR
jgi:hypothetical protein